jgi:cytochrome c
MNSFELNKILGAVLFVSLCILALNIVASAVYAPTAPEKPGYAIAVPEKPGAAPAAPEPEKPIAVLLASASAERGQTAARACAACHTFGKGEANKVGPNLWGVVGRDIASVPGFNYSAALRGKGGTWSFEELNAFLRNPRQHVPGTSMAFAGIARETQRADVIEYLRHQADTPVALPEQRAGAEGGGAGQAAPARAQ